jgi:hypothetical protein
MLTYVQRLRSYAWAVAVIVLLVGMTFNISARRKFNDIRLLNDARAFASAVEYYKQDVWKYPAGESVDLKKNVVLTENGFARGERIYYQGKMRSLQDITYSTDDDAYRISFTLNSAWPDQGLASNKCRITRYNTLQCE